MTDEQIEKALCDNLDKAVSEWRECYDILSYIRKLKAENELLKDEIAGLTSKAEAAESFKEENERLCVALKLAQTRAMDLERIPELFGGEK